MLDEVIISQAIVKSYNQKLLKILNVDVALVGAGPAGLTAAYLASKEGIDTLVLEKDGSVGGISKTVDYKNFLFDIGGHRFFTKYEEVENYIKMGNIFYTVSYLSYASALTLIIFGIRHKRKGKYALMPYPLAPGLLIYAKF